GLRETLLHHSRSIVDLRFPLRHRLAVDQLDQNGDVSGLDDVEDVFAHPIHDGAEDTEPGYPAPQGRAGLEPFVTEAADTIADARARSRHQHVTNGDAEIDGYAQHDERHGARHHCQCV